MGNDSSTTSTQMIALTDGPIILLDQDPDTLLSLELLIRKAFPDKEIFTSDRGKRAIDWLETSQPAFVITSIRLIDIDGIHVVLKSIINYPEVPVIVLSDKEDIKEYRASSKNLDNIHYMQKPFQERDLLKRLRQVFQSTPDSQINGLNLVNILQLVAAEVDYAHLELTSEESKGVITVENKYILFAATDIASGKQALAEIIDWKSINAQIFYRRKTRRININEPISALLLEICHRHDEKKSVSPNKRKPSTPSE
ncbi:MAG: response regulator [Verrucomicrobiota bacterium]